MDEILDYIENNLKRDLTLVELSQRYHYSVRQLYYCLYDITGMPIMTYIRRRKLVNAAGEIARGRKMYEVAVDYGFETQAGFYKAFIQCIGCTPSEFQNHQQLREAGKLGAKILAVREEWKSMEEIRIRKMEIGDVKSLWENIFSGNMPEEVKERVQKNILEMDRGNSVALVAVVDTNVIGTVLVKRAQHILTSHRAELSDVVVNPAFQKQGLGKRLCRESFVYAKQMGCDHIIASCRNDGAELFYKAIGMEECGTIPGGILEPWGERKTYDEIIFYKELSV